MSEPNSVIPTTETSAMAEVSERNPNYKSWYKIAFFSLLIVIVGYLGNNFLGEESQEVELHQRLTGYVELVAPTDTQESKRHQHILQDLKTDMGQYVCTYQPTMSPSYQDVYFGANEKWKYVAKLGV